MEQVESDEGEEREETVEEKIERLAVEIQDIQEQGERLLRSLSAITIPPVPEPLLKLRRAVKEKETERELLLEDQRASKVVEEYLKENPSILEKVDECPICLEPIFDVDKASFFICCGKPMCGSCKEPLLAAGNDICPFCRGPFPSGGEELSILRTKAAQGKAWAQCILGQKFYYGLTGLVEDDQKAESLLRSAADQGHAGAQYYLGQYERQKDNVVEACRQFEAAASQGNMAALSALAMFYYQGDVVGQDDMEAVRIATVSARLQDRNPCANEVLGYCFALGKAGLERSLVLSVYYYKLAIEEFELHPNTNRRYAWALINISSIYYPECLTPPSGDNNWPEALFWYRRAIAQLTDAETIPFFESYESKIREMCAYCCKSLNTETQKCCVECRAVYYCNRECQAADWKAGHKKDCVKSLKKRLRATGEFENI
mmetsp:Transcript_4511/g.10130  ORF Transcript_4511/g.10130 Transcript_4511/m.10130 type:complete len:432 (+) Transcript_4511:62-1357(+)